MGSFVNGRNVPLEESSIQHRDVVTLAVVTVVDGQRARAVVPGLIEELQPDHDRGLLRHHVSLDAVRVEPLGLGDGVLARLPRLVRRVAVGEAAHRALALGLAASLVVRGTPGGGLVRPRGGRDKGHHGAEKGE